MSFASSDPASGGTIVDILRRRAADTPEKTAFVHLRSDSERENLTYGALDARARGIGAWLRDRAANGGRVILAHPTGLDFSAAFFGCLYAGAQPVPQPANLRPRQRQRLAAVARDCGASLALSDTQTLTRLNQAEDSLTWFASDAIALAENEGAPTDTPALAYLQYTSGSTAEPRGVRITHANLTAHLRQLTATYDTKEGDTLVSWLPHFHDMGLVGKLLQAIYVGVPCILMSPLQFMQRPVRWLKAITEFRGSMSAAPNFGYELCLSKISAAEREGLDLSSWRVALNGAEPVRPDTVRRFAETFAPHGLTPEALSPCYGLAEATLMVSSSRPSQKPRIVTFQRELVSCGPPQDGVRVAIVDPESSQRMADGATGEIWVKGESVADSYFNAPEASAATFGARLGDGDGPYLRTGDLGFFDAGELFIAGRLKDLIILAGRNLHPQDVEQSVQAASPVLMAGRGAAFGVDAGNEERLVLVQELQRHATIDTEALLTEMRAIILSEHEAHAAAILLVALGTLPMTSSGKLARHAARDLFLAGKLSPIAAWHDPQW